MQWQWFNILDGESLGQQSNEINKNIYTANKATVGVNKISRGLEFHARILLSIRFSFEIEPFFLSFFWKFLI